jgi:hypothetical protein
MIIARRPARKKHTAPASRAPRWGGAKQPARSITTLVPLVAGILDRIGGEGDSAARAGTDNGGIGNHLGVEGVAVGNSGLGLSGDPGPAP